MNNRVGYLVLEQGGCDLYRLRKRMPEEKFSVVTTLHIVQQTVSARAHMRTVNTDDCRTSVARTVLHAS